MTSLACAQLGRQSIWLNRSTAEILDMMWSDLTCSVISSVHNNVWESEHKFIRDTSIGCVLCTPYLFYCEVRSVRNNRGSSSDKSHSMSEIEILGLKSELNEKSGDIRNKQPKIHLYRCFVRYLSIWNFEVTVCVNSFGGGGGRF